MAVSFGNLTKGSIYDRPFLADLWGYKGVPAISRGVVTPKKSKYIILFVTEEKQESLTQYKDYLVGEELHWEGEAKHGSDKRIVNALRHKDEIHLFHRKRHHSPFVYQGEIWLNEHNLRIDEPSQFIFTLRNKHEVNEPEGQYDVGNDFEHAGLEETERNALRSSRIGQGVFRDGLLRLWNGCAVTGYNRPALLLASHIKPWRISTNEERLDPYNGLLLQPTIDKLFDKGFVSFDKQGKLIRSTIISSDELLWLGIDPNSTLRRVPDCTMRYLKYHRENELDKPNKWLQSEVVKLDSR